MILADVRLIQTLFDRGASNEGLLEIAASHHDEDNILKFLVNQGAHDTDGKAIYQAARRGKPLLVSFLLQHVESKLVAESSGALHVAAEKGHLEVLRTLLDHGLSLNARNKEGLTPLIKACMPARVSCPAIQMLINQGALINAAAEHTNRMPCTIGDTPCRFTHKHLATRLTSNASARFCQLLLPRSTITPFVGWSGYQQPQ